MDKLVSAKAKTTPWLQLVINKSRGAYQAYNG